MTIRNGTWRQGDEQREREREIETERERDGGRGREERKGGTRIDGYREKD